MKNYASFQLYLLVVLSLGLTVGKLEAVAQSSESTKFAAIIPLTGNGAEHGEWLKRGFEMARADQLAKSRTAPEVLVQDSQGKNLEAVSAYRRITASNDISVVFSWGSGVALSLAPLVNQDKIVQMGVATSADKYSQPNDFNFRNYPTASQETDFLVELISKRFSVNKVAVVHTENDYGNSTAEMFKAAFQSAGGNITNTLQLRLAETDLRSHILALRKADPQLIFLAAYPVEGGAFLRQLRQQGLTVPVVGSVALFSSYETLRAMGQYLEGITLAAAMDVIPDESAFAKKYESLYGEPFGAQHVYSVRAYDAYIAVANAQADCESHTRNDGAEKKQFIPGMKDSNDPRERRASLSQSYATMGECIKDQLLKMSPMSGIGGIIEFDQNGDVEPTFTAYRVSDGKYVLLE